MIKMPKNYEVEVSEDFQSDITYYISHKIRYTIELLINQSIVNTVSNSYEEHKLKALKYEKIIVDNISYSPNDSFYPLHVDFRICRINTYGEDFNLARFKSALDFWRGHHTGYNIDFVKYDETWDEVLVGIGMK